MSEFVRTQLKLTFRQLEPEITNLNPTQFSIRTCLNDRISNSDIKMRNKLGLIRVTGSDNFFASANNSHCFLLPPWKFCFYLLSFPIASTVAWLSSPSPFGYSLLIANILDVVWTDPSRGRNKGRFFFSFLVTIVCCLIYRNMKYMVN